MSGRHGLATLDPVSSSSTTSKLPSSSPLHSSVIYREVVNIHMTGTPTPHMRHCTPHRVKESQGAKWMWLLEKTNGQQKTKDSPESLCTQQRQVSPLESYNSQSSHLAIESFPIFRL